MIDGKWHLRKVRGKWQGILRHASDVHVAFLPEHGSKYLCPIWGRLQRAVWERQHA